MATFLSDRELERYRRQLMHDGFTVEHQKKLKNATALIAGIGGLGGTAAVFLAVAGIGKMIFAHFGNLTLSNMNRQILMRDEWVGNSRVEQGMKTIREINPDVEIVIYDERTTPGNVASLLDGTEIALSARPNFSERRALNDACIRKNIPMIEAAMNGMEGYLFDIVPGVSPCLHCIFPESNPEWEELGFPVFGAVSGMLGCLMAMEAIKILTGFGKPLLSEMLVYNLTDTVFRKVRTRRDRDCTVCGGIGKEPVCLSGVI